jgi:CO dehydrogenase maturation factor
VKIAVGGRGGVGKTTLSALLAQTYAERGRNVLAVDMDPSPSLAEALAVPDGVRSSLRPISEMDELIEERTGAKPGVSGGFFTINPRVDDIPDRFSVLHKGVRLLEMGRVEAGGTGCICPESAMLRTLFTQLLFRQDEVLMLDMYAGVEHLGRATVDFVDAMVVVVGPTRHSLTAADQIEKMARDIGLTSIGWVGNRVRNEADLAFLADAANGGRLLGHLPDDPSAIEADRRGEAVYEASPSLREAAAQVADALDRLVGSKESLAVDER